MKTFFHTEASMLKAVSSALALLVAKRHTSSENSCSSRSLLTAAAWDKFLNTEKLTQIKISASVREKYTPIQFGEEPPQTLKDEDKTEESEDWMPNFESLGGSDEPDIEEKIKYGARGVVMRVKDGEKTCILKLQKPCPFGDEPFENADAHFEAEITKGDRIRALQEDGGLNCVVQHIACHNADGADDNASYIIMEEASSIPDDAPKNSEVCAFLTQLCAGLHEIHDNGLVHGDLHTNGNIMIKKGEEPGNLIPKFIDFGAAEGSADDDWDSFAVFIRNLARKWYRRSDAKYNRLVRFGTDVKRNHSRAAIDTQLDTLRRSRAFRDTRRRLADAEAAMSAWN